ncbi:hypothetical protein [Microvirga sp. VF16]|uniref:hypothetical protein n=1 Tax=Microvirga sp. VF16 TaxID=2807101 RepID=UPI00193E9872|nr:hypothetical protein [Microvirga sp. VF16]QRM35533.1 hypothetical protein JO965_45200 [Microvirga sp. VF16]
MEQLDFLDLLPVGADQFPGFTPQVSNFSFEFIAVGSNAILMPGLSLQLTQLLPLIRYLLLQLPDLLLSFCEQPPHIPCLLFGLTQLGELSV